ncbi:MAG TPA: hypothetical protein PKZ76_13210 [Xanthomonadaceae bacterium]|nr:hypothetical protein [Xanthomonadaceae bacterium]
MLLAGLLSPAPILAMGSAFTYQGTLEDQGQPAHGLYDFQFRLLNSNFTQVGTTLPFTAVPVNQGVFTVELDFGPSVGLFPGEFVRYLEIGIRPQGSSDPHEVLSPVTQLHPVPFSRRAEAVSNAAINNAALADGAVSNWVLGDNSVNSRVLGFSAVETDNLANLAVTTAKLANTAVTAGKIADGTVTNAKLANGAVTNKRIASNTIRLGRMAGIFFNANIGSVTLLGNACADFDLPISGTQVGDIPFVAMQGSIALPAGMSVTALRVPSANMMQIRVCNHAGVTRSWTSLPVIFMTLR